MLNYANLNDIEFEYLCQDIMQEMLHVKLKRYAAGRDGGIDLRLAAGDNDIIIQVKHYKHSSTSTLMSSLRAEAEKVKKLRPKQYFLCCSSTLSPQKTTEIYELFSPYMHSEESIVTLNEIEDFLQAPKNRPILEKHYKLWIESLGIFERFMDKAVFLDCESLLAGINGRINLFVKTTAFEKALDCLSHFRTLFIVGEPGSGKTMTSQMLLLHFASLGYRVRYTTENSNLSLLKQSLSSDPTTKEVILLDDCLGQAYFQMKESQCTELVALIKYVHLSKYKYLILNSRVTIFHEAQERTPEILQCLEHKEFKTYVLDMSEITSLEKAKILYNHLYFSGIPHEYYSQIREDRKYRKIIEHKNYSPRIIEFVTCPSRISGISPLQYFQFIMGKLDNPQDIWRDEYQRKLQPVDRIFLLTLYSLTNTSVELSLLKECFNCWVRRDPQIDNTFDQFEAALARLQDGFIKIIDKNGCKHVSVVNPSVNDFLSALIKSNSSIRNMLFDNAFALDQFAKLLPKDDFAELVKAKIQTGDAIDLIFSDEKQQNAFFAVFIAQYHILDKRYMKYLHAYLCSPTSMLIGYQVIHFEETIIAKLVTPDNISFYQLGDAIQPEDLRRILEKENFYDLVNIVKYLSPLYCGIDREIFLEIAASSIEEAIEDLCGGVDVGDYDYDASAAVEAAKEDASYNHEIDAFDVCGYIEAGIEDIVNSDIQENIRSLPEDLQIRILLNGHYSVVVNGAWEMANNYLSDEDYDNEYVAPGNQWDEIDSIFSQI